MTVTHPLEMLTGDEINRAVEILRASGRVPEGALFAHIVLHEPHKDELARVEGGRSGRAARPRGGRARPGHGAARSGRVGDQGRDRRLARPRRHAAGAADDRGDRRDLHHEGAPRLHRRARQARHHRISTTCRSTRGRPACSATTARKAAASRAASRSCAPTRPTTGTPGPIEGLIVHFDMADNEVIEVIDHGVTPLPPNPASYYAEDQPRMRAGPQADLDHAARRRRASPSTATASSGRSGRSASASIRTRAWCCTRSPTTTTAARVRSCTARRSRRWSCPTATRASCTAGRTRSTRASGASAA